MDNQPSNLVIFPTTDNHVVGEATRRRGLATDLICGCCRLPFAEAMGSAGAASHVVGAVPAEHINVYSRHYGKQHSNKIRLGEGVRLLVTDRREFVIVPLTSVAALVA